MVSDEKIIKAKKYIYERLLKQVSDQLICDINKLRPDDVMQIAAWYDNKVSYAHIFRPKLNKEERCKVSIILYGEKSDKDTFDRMS